MSNIEKIQMIKSCYLKLKKLSPNERIIIFFSSQENVGPKSLAKEENYLKAKWPSSKLIYFGKKKHFAGISFQICSFTHKKKQKSKRGFKVYPSFHNQTNLVLIHSRSEQKIFRFILNYGNLIFLTKFFHELFSIKPKM